MSVIMTLRITGHPEAMERYAKEHPERMQSIVDAAKQHGLIAHRFYGSEDEAGILVIDEWPDRQSFEAFFTEQQSEIAPMMEAVGATMPAGADFWHELATGDEYGWGA